MAADSVHTFNSVCRGMHKNPTLITLNQPDPSGKTEIAMYNGYVYSMSRFLSESLLALVTAHNTAQRNALYVIDYLKRVGFRNVTVKRGVCEFNGRHNVWIVRAVKA